LLTLVSTLKELISEVLPSTGTPSRNVPMECPFVSAAPEQVTAVMPGKTPVLTQAARACGDDNVRKPSPPIVRAVVVSNLCRKVANPHRLAVIRCAASHFMVSMSFPMVLVQREH
jgi:hypothetical protein